MTRTVLVLVGPSHADEEGVSQILSHDLQFSIVAKKHVPLDELKSIGWDISASASRNRCCLFVLEAVNAVQRLLTAVASSGSLKTRNPSLEWHACRSAYNAGVILGNFFSGIDSSAAQYRARTSSRDNKGNLLGPSEGIANTADPRSNLENSTTSNANTRDSDVSLFSNATLSQEKSKSNNSFSSYNGMTSLSSSYTLETPAKSMPSQYFPPTPSRSSGQARMLLPSPKPTDTSRPTPPSSSVKKKISAYLDKVGASNSPAASPSSSHVGKNIDPQPVPLPSSNPSTGRLPKGTGSEIRSSWVMSPAPESSAPTSFKPVGDAPLGTKTLPKDGSPIKKSVGDRKDSSYSEILSREPDQPVSAVGNFQRDSMPQIALPKRRTSRMLLMQDPVPAYLNKPEPPFPPSLAKKTSFADQKAVLLRNEKSHQDFMRSQRDVLLSSDAKSPPKHKHRGLHPTELPGMTKAALIRCGMDPMAARAALQPAAHSHMQRVEKQIEKRRSMSSLAAVASQGAVTGPPTIAPKSNVASLLRAKRSGNLGTCYSADISEASSVAAKKVSSLTRPEKTLRRAVSSKTLGALAAEKQYPPLPPVPPIPKQYVNKRASRLFNRDAYA